MPNYGSIDRGFRVCEKFTKADIVVFHSAFLMQNPILKGVSWSDMKLYKNMLIFVLGKVCRVFNIKYTNIL